MLDASWQAMQREAQLAAEQTAHGVTMLGRANHAQTGIYAQAFFGISIGLERTGKLIVVADHVISNKGAFPGDAQLRTIGHDLAVLLDACEKIGGRLSPSRRYAGRPNDRIHKGIVEVVSNFAVKLRYYNLNYLAGAAKDQRDPVEFWWTDVAEEILKRHYSKRQREGDEEAAAMSENMLDGVAHVMHHAEGGEEISDVSALVQRAGATRVVQAYGRLYTLQIVRWLALIVYELSSQGAHARILALQGLDEPFWTFLNKDAYLRTRKTWSIYPK